MNLWTYFAVSVLHFPNGRWSGLKVQSNVGSLARCPSRSGGSRGFGVVLKSLVAFPNLVYENSKIQEFLKNSNGNGALKRQQLRSKICFGPWSIVLGHSRGCPALLQWTCRFHQEFFQHCRTRSISRHLTNWESSKARQLPPKNSWARYQLYLRLGSLCWQRQTLNPKFELWRIWILTWAPNSSQMNRPSFIFITPTISLCSTS